MAFKHSMSSPSSSTSGNSALTDQEHKQRARNEFGEELARLGHERLGIRAEYAGGGICGGWDCADARAAWLFRGELKDACETVMMEWYIPS